MTRILRQLGLKALLKRKQDKKRIRKEKKINNKIA
jgi:hypothetical protein